MKRIQSMARALVLAALPVILSANPTCNQPVSGVVELHADMVCTNTWGLWVNADNTTINLNGHTISCTGDGFMGSCQGLATRGISVNEHKNVTINGPGKITGFHTGVLFEDGSGNTVQNVEITGPPSAGYGNNLRPETFGVYVFQASCPPDYSTALKIAGNTISNQTLGINLVQSNCLKVNNNFVSNNRSDLNESTGIKLSDSGLNTIDANVVEYNGNNDSRFVQAGVAVLGFGAINNTITNNQVTNNCSDGILFTKANPGANVVVGNTAKHNGESSQRGACKGVARGTYADLAERAGAGGNRISLGNICNTQAGPVPAGTCTAQE